MFLFMGPIKLKRFLTNGTLETLEIDIDAKFPDLYERIRGAKTSLTRYSLLSSVHADTEVVYEIVGDIKFVVNENFDIFLGFNIRFEDLSPKKYRDLYIFADLMNKDFARWRFACSIEDDTYLNFKNFYLGDDC